MKKLKPITLVLIMGLIFIVGCQKKFTELKSPEIQKETKAIDKITARSFAENILRLEQNSDYSNIYDLLTDEDRGAETKTEYVKRAIESSQGTTITGWEIKEILDESEGVSVQYVLNYKNILGDGTTTDILKLVNRGERWFLSIGSVDMKNAIVKGVGDEVVLAKIKFKVDKVQEQETINNRYNSINAKEGAKFVIVNLSITNLTKDGLSFPEEVFILIDNQDRKFKIYRDTIGNIDNYFNVRELSPGILEKGVVVYEIPADTISYSFVVRKAGTNELYRVVLK